MVKFILRIQFQTYQPISIALKMLLLDKCSFGRCLFGRYTIQNGLYGKPACPWLLSLLSDIWVVRKTGMSLIVIVTFRYLGCTENRHVPDCYRYFHISGLYGKPACPWLLSWLSDIWVVRKTRMSLVVIVTFRYLPKAADAVHVTMFSGIALVIYVFCAPIQATYYSAVRKGLTEVPRNIPCHATQLNLLRNAITRIENDTFPCHNKLRTIYLAYNDLVYVDRDAFQFCFELNELIMSRNPRLQQLPPTFGPNTANMTRLLMQYFNLQSLPEAYFRQFKSLQSLAIADMGINGALDNNVLNGLTNVRRLVTGCCSSIPNMTGHLPRLELLIFSGLPKDRIPDENMYGLHMSTVTIQKPCSHRPIPVFEGAVRLEYIVASKCKVTELPDFSKHRSLKEFKVNTARFQCNPKCCWMLYENITADGLNWIPSITCYGPPELSGFQIANISTLQARCFESKSIYLTRHVLLKKTHPASNYKNQITP